MLFSSFKKVIIAALPIFFAGFLAFGICGSAIFGNKAAGSFVFFGLIGSLAYLSFWLFFSIFVSRTKKGPTTSLYSLSAAFAAALLPLIIYFPYFFHRTNLEGDSAGIPPLSANLSGVLLLIWSLLMLAALIFLILADHQNRFFRWVGNRPKKILTFMICAWVVIFFVLDYLKIEYMHVNSINSALFSEALRDAINENGLMFSEVLYSNGASIFAVHINGIFFFLLPLFKIWPDYKLLLLISDIALALSAWPTYLIARRRFSVNVSLLLAAMMILHPIMTAQPGRSDFSELRFMPILFLAAFYFFEKKRFLFFLISISFLISIREDMGLLVLFFGIYALLLRRTYKWVLLPLSVGVLWFLIMGAWVLPLLSPSGTATRAAIRYSHLGDGGLDIAKNLLLEPWRLFEVIFSTPSHIGAAFGLLVSFGLGIQFLSPIIVFSIPAVAELLLQKSTTFANFMALLSAPTLMLSFIFGLSNLKNFLRRYPQINLNKTVSFIAIISIFVSVSVTHVWFNPDLYTPRYNYEEALAALDMIPENSSVMVPEFLLIYAGQKHDTRGFHQIAYEVDFTGSYSITEKYVILDKKIPSRKVDERYYFGLEKVSEFILDSPNYQKIFENNEIELYVHESAKF